MRIPNPFHRGRSTGGTTDHQNQITREIAGDQELPRLRGPLTAVEALNAILTAVRQIDEEFRLTFVGSGEAINHEGRAYEWDFFFEFPRRNGLGDYAVHLCPSGEDDEGPWCLDWHVRPLQNPLARSFGVAPAPARPALPLDLRDSAEAVRVLQEQGADFVSGDSHMTLSSKALPNGELVWETTCWDKVYQTPLV